jgi:uridine kinase
MKGDSIIVEEHHRKAASGIVPVLLPILQASKQRYTISVAGQSGAGKSETAMAIALSLAGHGFKSLIFQQDDYFIHPPRTNDATRRADISWVGTQEVKLDLMDEHLTAFLEGAGEIEKPLVDYHNDAIGSEVMEPGSAQVAIADGTYTTLLKEVMCHVFIDRDYLDTRGHREKRRRDDSELDPFIDRVLEIEHEIISANKALADIVVNRDYSITVVSERLRTAD